MSTTVNYTSRRVSGFTRPILTPFLLACSTATLLVSSSPPSAHANVYATDIRILGSTSSSATSATVFVPCDNAVLISYRLNEPADAGVIVEIHSEKAVVRAFTNAPGNPGTLRGLSTRVWDLRNEQGEVVPFGVYTVHITATANGYVNWTQISDDLNAGNYVFQPRGIAVNRNAHSPYYGRVFVANGQVGFDPESEPGDRLGIQMLNADGSRAAAGGFSAGGWFLNEANSLPWKIEVADDDFVYINDWFDRGLVLRFDQNVSADSRRPVLRSDNRPGAADLSGPFITGTGANTQVWMADSNNSASVGIRRWTVTGDGTLATNDLGVTVVEAGTDSHLSVAPYDVAVDRSNRIYTIQFRDASGDPAHRVMRFPAYNGSLGPLTNSDWQIGSGDDNLGGASGIAVDPTNTYVAVAFAGIGDGFSRVGGGVRIFDAENGAAVQTLTPAPFHDHTDVAWDNVGNLYLCDNWDSLWRVYSPPGANTNTTVAPQTLEVAPPPLSPYLQTVGYTNGQFQFTLCGNTNVEYVIVASTNVLAGLQTWAPVLTNNDSSPIRLITVNAPPDRRFFSAHPMLPVP
jgi:hypothetical protein